MSIRTPLRGNRDLFKAINRNVVLNIIRRERVLSRTQLTELAGLSVGAVSQIIGELIEDGWVLESGEGDYTGGRRQMLLRLNPEAGYAIGVKLMENRVVCAVTNFESQMLHYQDYAIQSGSEPDALCDALTEAITSLIREVKLSRDQFFGAGIGLAGVIHQQTGVVHYSPFFGWKDVPLASMLQERLGIPIYVENDVNTLTLSEHLFGSGRHHNNFVVVTVGRGVGMGMVIDGKLYQGARGGAGELGHIVLDLSLSQQHLPEDGSLETLASDPAVLRMMRHTFQREDAAKLSDVVEAAAQGDPQAQEALARSGEYLGVGLAAVVNMLCPNLLIISGEGVAAGDYRLQPMLRALRRYTFNGLLDDVDVIIEPTDDRTWARGAASLVMSKVFESPRVEVQANK